MVKTNPERQFNGEIRLLELALEGGKGRLRRAARGRVDNLRGIYDQIAWMVEDRKFLEQNRDSILGDSNSGIVALPSGRAIDLTTPHLSLVGRVKEVIGGMISG